MNRARRASRVGLLAVVALVCAVLAAPVAAAAAAGDVTRYGGQVRYDTSAAISTATFGAGVPVVYVASGEDFPDALSATAAAAKEGGPVLLTHPRSIPAAIGRELRRLAPKRIVVLGGSSAVSDEVVRQLDGYTAGSVERRSGATRYDTAVQVSRASFAAGVPAVVLASGSTFPDALSGAALAGRLGAPVLLTPSGALPGAVRDELRRLAPKRVIVLGGGSAVSGAAADQAAQLTGRTPERLGGADRFATSAAISAASGSTRPDRVFIASGENFPDALSGAVAAARANASLLLVGAGAMPAPIGRELVRLSPASATVLGGTSAVGSAVSDLVRDFGLRRAGAAGATLDTNTQLAPGACLRAGSTSACVSAQGAVVVQRGGATVWTSASSGAEPFALRVRADGDLALFARTGAVIWRASTQNSGARTLLVTADGDAQLRTAGGAVRWSSLTSEAAPEWQLPFESGQRWAAGGPHSSLGTNTATRGSLDFGPTRGGTTGNTRVVTIAPGTVELFQCGGGRNYLQVDHGGGWESTYYHLKNEQRQLVGKTVPAGTYLGDVAQTLPCGGGSTFAHVHLTIRFNGTPVSVEGMTFGGYTVRSSGRDYSGTWSDGNGRTVLTATGGAACCLQAKGEK